MVKMSGVLDYMQLCRLCLVKDKVNVPIFGDATDVRQIFLKITACLPVKISQDDNLPKNICDSCLYKVDLLYQFYNTTANAEKQLIQWLDEIGVDVNIKSAGLPPQLSHAHPHSMKVDSLVKEERHEAGEGQHLENSAEYITSPQLYVGYNQQFAQANTSHENNGEHNNTPVKRTRGRPSSIKKDQTPATTTSTNKLDEDESMDEDSSDRGGMQDDSDDSMEETGGRIAKEEAESEEEYDVNAESLEPTTFVGVPNEAPCDADQPGPSGLNKPAVSSTDTGYANNLPEGNRIKEVVKATNYFAQEKSHVEENNFIKDCNIKEFNSDYLDNSSITYIEISEMNTLQEDPDINNKKDNVEQLTDSPPPLHYYDTPNKRLLVKLPKGIRLKKMTDQTNPEKGKETCGKITNGSRKFSVLDELMNKLNCIPHVKTEKPAENLKKEDTTAIVENLKKCGLIVKKIPNNNLKSLINSSDKLYSDKMHCDVFYEGKEENCNNNDDFDYINFNDGSDHESEYEIETLDDDDSDFEYIPSLKGKVKIENPGVEADNKAKAIEPKKSYKKGEFIKIKSTSYLCIMCNTKYPSLNLLTDHLKNPEPCFVMRVPCTICGKEFPNKSRCTSHMQIHKEKPKFFCDKCGKMFHNTIALSAHLEMMHTEYFDAMGDKFQCKLCDHEAPTKPLVLHHVNVTHLHVSTFLCDICGKSFLNESGLKAHIMIHRDTKSFLCQICSKAFKMQSALRAHIKTHSQEKRFICDECGKSFKKNCTLREHKKCHSGEFTFNCYICDKRFISKSTLNTHIKNHAA